MQFKIVRTWAYTFVGENHKQSHDIAYSKPNYFKWHSKIICKS